MAKAQGVSPATVQRIWDAHGLRPHRVRTFKLSNDPRFTEKLTDVVGLYLNPPDRAIVLCVDEKSQIQAWDRTQASLPMKRGRAGTMTHDYKRNGTTTLFAALSILDGSVVGQCLQFLIDGVGEVVRVDKVIVGGIVSMKNASHTGISGLLGRSSATSTRS